MKYIIYTDGGSRGNPGHAASAFVLIDEKGKKLEEKGYTYTTSDGVYFDTSKFKDYGKLAKLQKEELKAGIRVEMREKKHNTDFALWGRRKTSRVSCSWFEVERIFGYCILFRG